MTYHFSSDSDLAIERIVQGLADCKYFSERDGVYVVSVMCDECWTLYTEVAAVAERKVVDGDPLHCLWCDVDADAPESVTVTKKGEGKSN